jgi:hypothetical protein
MAMTGRHRLECGRQPAVANRHVRFLPSPFQRRMCGLWLHKQANYYWFVPEDRFNDGWLTVQSAKKDSDRSHAAKAAMANVKQFAVCVPSSVRFERLVQACIQQGVKLPEELL